MTCSLPLTGHGVCFRPWDQLWQSKHPKVGSGANEGGGHALGWLYGAAGAWLRGALQAEQGPLGLTLRMGEGV